MKFVFRADATKSVGAGHVARCAALASSLQDLGHATFLATRVDGDTTCSVGFPGHVLPIATDTGPIDETADARLTLRALASVGGEADAFVVDHYGLGSGWETTVRPSCRAILAIDDLANRTHDCDILLDQNYYGSPESRYEGLTSAVTLLGPKYALLRGEFREARLRQAPRSASVSRVLVSFGGSDPANMSSLVAEALVSSPRELGIDVVVGCLGSPDERLVRLADHPRVGVHVDTDRMAWLMSRADLFVGAAGGTTWERCCLGLPSLVIAVADNQVEPSRALQELGAIRYLGRPASLGAAEVSEAVEDVADDVAALGKMSAEGMALVDGLGSQRVAELLAETAGLRR